VAGSDNLRAGVVKPDVFDPKVNRAYVELAAHYGVLVDPARVARPKDKPRIEGVQRYIRSSFFAGRDYASLGAMVAEARRWSAEVAGQRTPRALEGRTPLEVFGAEEAGVLLPLPVVPFELARWTRPKVGPDAHAKVRRTLYSLPYRLIGVRLDARATAATVHFFVNAELVNPSLPGQGPPHRLGRPTRGAHRVLHAHAGVVPGPGRHGGVGLRCAGGRAVVAQQRRVLAATGAGLSGESDRGVLARDLRRRGESRKVDRLATRRKVEGLG
jgi:hypothetical protein